MQTPAGQGVGAKLVAQCAVEGPEHTTSPQAMNAREITKALEGSWHGSYGLCQCPAHDDGRTPALKITDDARKDDGVGRVKWLP